MKAYIIYNYYCDSWNDFARFHSAYTDRVLAIDALTKLQDETGDHSYTMQVVDLNTEESFA